MKYDIIKTSPAIKPFQSTLYFFHFPSFSPPDIELRKGRRELKQTGRREVTKVTRME